MNKDDIVQYLVTAHKLGIPQTKYILEFGDKYCALGVVAHLSNNPVTVEWLVDNISYEIRDCLRNLNDNLDLSFIEIAKYLVLSNLENEVN